MPRQELPDNWEDDTSFDGPEHWGIDQRWKHLFPKSGGRESSNSSDSSISGNERDGACSVDSDTATISANGAKSLTTVDISKDDDDHDHDDRGDDGISLSSDDDIDYSGSAITKRKGSVVRRKLPVTAPQREQREVRVASPSLSRSSKSANSKETNEIYNHRSSSSSRSSSSKARRDEARMTARRWRSGTKSTEPASSSRAGLSGSAYEVSLRDARELLTSSEEEEEFDDSEANITGHERTSPPASTTRRRRASHKTDSSNEDDGTILPRSSKNNHNSGSSGGRNACGSKTGKGVGGYSSAERERGPGAGTGGGGGGATSPFACNTSSSDDGDFAGVGVSSVKHAPQEEDIESSDDGLVDSDSGREDSRFPRLSRTTTTSIVRHRTDGKQSGRRSSVSASSARKKGRRSSDEVNVDGRPRKDNGRKLTDLTESLSSGSPSEHRRSNTASPRGTLLLMQGAGGSASKKRPGESSGGKKPRRVVPAKRGQDGWISKGGGGGGTSPRNPVDAFQGPQASIRKNSERGLTQSKLSFPVLDS